MKKLEELLEWGGTKRDITFLILSAAALLASIFGFQPLPLICLGICHLMRNPYHLEP